MLLLVAPGSVGSTVRLVDLDFGVLVGVPRGAEARSDMCEVLAGYKGHDVDSEEHASSTYI